MIISKIIPKNGIPTPLLFLSHSSEVYQRKRQILEKKADGLPLIINLKKNNSKGYLYIFVLCQEEKCQYSLSFNGTQIAEIYANSVFSYLVTEKNQQMKFQAIEEAENENYLTIGVEGNYTAQININGNSNYEQLKFHYGKIITLPINNPNNKNLAKFTIKLAKFGEYLAINDHVVNNNQAKENLLYPNGPIVMDILSGKDRYFKEECFPTSAFS